MTPFKLSILDNETQIQLTKAECDVLIAVAYNSAEDKATTATYTEAEPACVAASAIMAAELIAELVSRLPEELKAITLEEINLRIGENKNEQSNGED